MIVAVPLGYASEYIWMLAVAGAAAVLWYLVGLVMARRRPRPPQADQRDPLGLHRGRAATTSVRPQQVQLGAAPPGQQVPHSRRYW